MSIKVDSEAPGWAISPCPKCGVYTSAAVIYYDIEHRMSFTQSGLSLVVYFDHSNHFTSRCNHVWFEVLNYKLASGEE